MQQSLGGVSLSGTGVTLATVGTTSE